MKFAIAKAIIQEFKSRPCVDCVREGRAGIWPYWVMDLDHARGTKVFTLAKVGRGIIKLGIRLKDLTEEMLRRELSKCDPVCANHHRMRTYARLHGVSEVSAKEKVHI